MQGVANSGFSFGEFTLDPRHRVLAKGGINVALKLKTLDLLLRSLGKQRPECYQRLCVDVRLNPN